VLSGIGQGSSFPWLSNATGRPAMEDSFTVETVGKGCCAATTVALKKNVMNTLANSVARVIAHHQDCRNEYDRSSDQS
jgi:hypothetical protein